MKQYLDKGWVGALIGLVIPAVFGLLFLDSIRVGLTFAEIISFLHTPSLMVKFLCVMLFPDMGGVFVLNSLEMWKACRGMFGAIGIYTIIGIIVFCI